LARDASLDSPIIHMDETTVQVLKEPDKGPTSQSYMWVQRGGPPGKPVVLYDYHPSRSGQVPLRLLAASCQFAKLRLPATATIGQWPRLKALAGPHCDDA